MTELLGDEPDRPDGPDRPVEQDRPVGPDRPVETVERGRLAPHGPADRRAFLDSLRDPRMFLESLRHPEALLEPAEHDFRGLDAGTDRRIDTLFLVVGGAAAIWLAVLIVRHGIDFGWNLLWIAVPFWGFLAYLALPRLHRILTGIYVPGYFIGRTRTSDGLLGDPVNLALLGSEAQVHSAMKRAGWTRADDMSVIPALRLVRATLFRRSYLQAPVSPLQLFDREQDFTYQQEVDGSPGKRHHVRFWRCPPGWPLPGGYRVDWLAAGSFDRAIGLSLFTLQVTHRISPDIDSERDHIVDTVIEAEPAATVQVIEDFATGYHHRNGGGDEIQTDGDLPVLDLRGVDGSARVGRPDTDSRRRRPAATSVGAALLAARAVALVVFAVVLGLTTTPLLPILGDLEIDETTEQGVLVTIVALSAAVAFVDLVLAFFVFLGRNWARLLALVITSVGTAAQLLGFTAAEGTPFLAVLPGIAIDVLAIFALSSDSALVYARRDRSERKRVFGRPGNASAF